MYFLIHGVTEKLNFVVDLFPVGTTRALIFASLWFFTDFPTAETTEV